MEYRRLGTSALTVSEIGLGSWLTYGGGVLRETAAACVDRAFELGINFVDTANVYGRGAAEELLGELLASRPRDSYVLATKLYFPMGNGDRGLSRAQVSKQLDASLRRLRTDVDLYGATATRTPLRRRAALPRSSARKVRYLGFSVWSAGQSRRQALPTSSASSPASRSTPLLWRAQACRDPALRTGGIAGGLVAPRQSADKYRGGRPARLTCRLGDHGVGDGPLHDEGLRSGRAPPPVAAAPGSRSQLALAWVLRGRTSPRRSSAPRARTARGNALPRASCSRGHARGDRRALVGLVQPS
jgi:aryl-alcohol dehydrogenase-like predicted oxidoreductase